MTAALVKVMGERNSGTNFALEVIDANFDATCFDNHYAVMKYRRPYFQGAHDIPRQRREIKEAWQDENHNHAVPINGGWKHAAITDRFLDEFARPKAVVLAIIVRHPAMWLRSMHRNPFHAMAQVHGDFSRFIRASWVARPRDELKNRFLANPVELMAEKAKSYLRATRYYERTLLFRYEDMVLNPQSVFEQISTHLTRTSDAILMPTRQVRDFGRMEKTEPDYVEKARASKWAALSREDRAFVTGLLAGSHLLDLYPD